MNDDILTVGLAQIAPVWLKRQETLEKICAYVETAAKQNCQLVAFGEALLPGYPFWLERTDAARFNARIQKDLHAYYLQQAVQIEMGDLDPICGIVSNNNIAVILGCIERAADRGGHSVYCTLVYIDPQGYIQPTHRKLMPTYEERLSWAQGDGYGLNVHRLGAFSVGGLNCWENWMPLARSALYAQGEDLHVAIWPGNERNTNDITRFIAKESRSYVISVSGLMRKQDIPQDLPYAELILQNSEPCLANGGSCIAAPDGSWLIEPAINEERLLTAVLDHATVRRERQNFDPSGHYSRPDVTQLMINKKRQRLITIED